MRKLFSIIFLFILFHKSYSQELFPHVDPASNIPKGVFGLRIINEGFTEINQFRFAQNYRLMFGISSKVMASLSFNFSNRHQGNYSDDFIVYHSYVGFHTHGIQKGKKYPFIYNSFNANFRYRFLSIDGTHSHFRMLAYAELSSGQGAHAMAEPNLMGSNSGAALGLTATKLKNRFAISATVGGIFPQIHNEQLSDSVILSIKHGKAFNYSLSMGLLCLPFKYKNYKQTNVNIYAEFVGKNYEAAKISRNGEQILIDKVPSLEKGNYLEFHPSVQFIFNSNLRIDFSYGMPIYKRSYMHTAPVYFMTIQRYFYSK